jgi:hypothetical protein
MILPYKEVKNMNTSSFLCGVLLGAAASMIMSKKRSALMSSLGQSGSRGAGERAKDKIFGMAMTGFGNTSASGDNNHEHGSKSGGEDHKSESKVKPNESNLSMVKDFIRSNPDVKQEVEKILKETHSAIPGL